jgi:hypothetical protein
MNLRTMLSAVGALCALAAPAAAQDSPAPPAPAGAFPAAPLAPAVAPVVAPPAEAPPTGTSWIVWGSLLAAAGAGNFALAPACELAGNLRHPALCVGTSIAFGAAFLAAGIPLVIVGVGKRKTWEDSTKGVTVAPVQRGAALSWGGRGDARSSHGRASCGGARVLRGVRGAGHRLRPRGHPAAARSELHGDDRADVLGI